MLIHTPKVNSDVSKLLCSILGSHVYSMATSLREKEKRRHNSFYFLNVKVTRVTVFRAHPPKLVTGLLGEG